MLELYENIRKLRIKRGLSQAELARLTGYTDRSSVAKIEKGEVDLQQSKIEAFARALRVSPGDLMGYEPEYQESGLKEIGYMSAKDIELIEAYKSASEDIKAAVRRVLGL